MVRAVCGHKVVDRKTTEEQMDRERMHNSGNRLTTLDNC